MTISNQSNQTPIIVGLWNAAVDSSGSWQSDWAAASPIILSNTYVTLTGANGYGNNVLNWDTSSNPNKGVLAIVNKGPDWSSDPDAGAILLTTLKPVGKGTVAGEIQFNPGNSGRILRMDSNQALTFFDASHTHTPHGQQTVTGALSAVTDAAAKAVLTSIIAALAEATGYALVIDGTT
jgi:hypothetical protein